MKKLAQLPKEEVREVDFLPFVEALLTEFSAKYDFKKYAALNKKVMYKVLTGTNV